MERLYAYEKVDKLNGHTLSVVNVEDRTLDFHVHDDSDELFYVIEGSFQLETKDGLTMVNAAEFIIVPKGVLHRPAVTSMTRSFVPNPVIEPQYRRVTKDGEEMELTRTEFDMKKQVLILDSDIKVCKQIKYSLQDDATQVYYTGCVREALRLFAERAYTMVIVDIAHSETDGMELLRMLHWQKPVPICLLLCGAAFLCRGVVVGQRLNKAFRHFFPSL